MLLMILHSSFSSRPPLISIKHFIVNGLWISRPHVTPHLRPHVDALILFANKTLMKQKSDAHKMNENEKNHRKLRHQDVRS
jgi:hypothetical protein